MISLITGQPGNGKTLMAMALMAEEQARNARANSLPEGSKNWEPLRRFYSNVNGATTEENPEAFPWVERMPDHNDWTKLPDGCFVQMDEAHSDGATPGLERYGKQFPSTGRPGESDDMRIRSMSTSRHRGFDLQLITQWPSKIHHQVRALVGQHVHMARAFGLERAGVLKWGRVQVDPYDEAQREKAEEEIWVYPKDLYRRYFSATLHTSAHKFKMPKQVWKGLSMAIAACLCLWAFVSWANGKRDSIKAAGLSSGAAQGQGGAAPAAPPVGITVVSNPGTGAFVALAAPAAPVVIGYIDSPRGCRVWGESGHQLDMSQEDCRALVKRGMPVFIPVTSRNKDRSNKDHDDNAKGEDGTFVTGTSSPFGSVASYGALGVGDAHADASSSIPEAPSLPISGVGVGASPR